MTSHIGGKLHGVGLDAFLQMAQMESITCTLTVTSGQTEGKLFLKEGVLIAAETGSLRNAEAATRIISWEQSAIEILDACDKSVDEIRQPLMNLLMDGMRLRDEHKAAPPHAEPEAIGNGQPAAEAPAAEAPEETELTLELASPPSPAPPPRTPPSPEKAPTSEKQVPPPRPPENNARPIKKRPAATGTTAKPPRKRGVKYLCFGAALLVVCGVIGSWLWISAKREKAAYETLRNRVDTTIAVDKKIALMENYLGTDPGPDYAQRIRQRIETLEKSLAEEAVAATRRAADQMVADGNLEGALAAYEDLRKRIPARFQAQANAAISSLREKIATRAFSAMETAALALGPERINTYQDFLSRHPDSPHQNKVRDLIREMHDEYYLYIKRRIAINEAAENWQACLDLAAQFLAAYPDSDHTTALRQYQAECTEKHHAALAFAQLLREAEALGNDYKAAAAVFQDYLKVYPKTPSREDIQREIVRLESLAEHQRLTQTTDAELIRISAAGNRFTANDRQTVTDQHTGLMWCLLDAQAVLDRCLTYEEATTYVMNLDTGGHGDWRLPTPGELLALHRGPAPYPAAPERWYWSSDTQKRYLDQWVIAVTVVIPNLPPEEMSSQKESWRCGSVRPVRGPVKKNSSARP